MPSQPFPTLPTPDRGLCCDPHRPAFAGTRRVLVQRAGTLACALLAAPWTSTRAQAQSPAPAPVVLTLSGRLDRAGPGGQVDFDMAALAALPQHRFNTRTPWFDKPREFSGPLLRDVLAAAGAQGDTLRLGALNDYRVDMPVSDTRRYDVLLARLLDGRPMRVRDHGPLFLVYPYDQVAGLHNVVFYSRSVWQLRTIELL